MQEMDKLKRARMYMEKLAEGIDPITDTELPSDSVLNNVRLSRCFAYVARVLGRLVDTGGDETLRERQGMQPPPSSTTANLCHTALIRASRGWGSRQRNAHSSATTSATAQTLFANTGSNPTRASG